MNDCIEECSVSPVFFGLPYVPSDDGNAALYFHLCTQQVDWVEMGEKFVKNCERG